MDKRWGQWAAIAMSVALSACGGGGGDTPASTSAPVADNTAAPSTVTPAEPAASTPVDPTPPANAAAVLQAWLGSLPASEQQSGAVILEAMPAAGAFTVLGPNWLAGRAHEISFGVVRGQLASDTTAALVVLPSTPTQDLYGHADLIIGRIDGDVKVGEATSARQFSYVVAKPASSLPDSGTVTYSLSQATAGDVRVSGSTVPAAARVTITAATLTANFASEAASPVALTVTGTLGGQTYTYTLPVSLVGQIDRAHASFKADNGSGTVVEGVFTGSGAAQVGLHYTVTIDGGSLDGSLILTRR